MDVCLSVGDAGVGVRLHAGCAQHCYHTWTYIIITHSAIDYNSDACGNINHLPSIGPQAVMTLLPEQTIPLPQEVATDAWVRPAPPTSNGTVAHAHVPHHSGSGLTHEIRCVPGMRALRSPAGALQSLRRVQAHSSTTTGVATLVATSSLHPDPNFLAVPTHQAGAPTSHDASPPRHRHPQPTSHCLALSRLLTAQGRQHTCPRRQCRWSAALLYKASRYTGQPHFANSTQQHTPVCKPTVNRWCGTCSAKCGSRAYMCPPHEHAVGAKGPTQTARHTAGSCVNTFR